MPHRQINGANLFYDVHGAGPETILFAHGLLWSGEMYCDQIAVLEKQYRCITFDFRGQGRSEVTQAGYDVESLYADAVALIEALGCAPCHFVGLSMGGFVALRLAIRRPDLLKSLILIESSPDPQPPAKLVRYRMLNIVARWIGFGPVANPVMAIMFGRTFLNDPARAALRREWKQRLLANHRLGITRAVAGIITCEGVADQVGRIRVPTLIIVGDEDVATERAQSERLHAGIAHSKLVVIPRAGHTSTVEEPVAVTTAMADFLANVAG